MATLRVVTTAFTNTGANMSAQANARRERQALFESAPWWARQLRQIIIAQHRLRRLASGAYAPAPYEYAIRTRGGPAQRQVFQVTRPTFRWVRPAA